MTIFVAITLAFVTWLAIAAVHTKIFQLGADHIFRIIAIVITFLVTTTPGVASWNRLKDIPLIAFQIALAMTIVVAITLAFVTRLTIAAANTKIFQLVAPQCRIITIVMTYLVSSTPDIASWNGVKVAPLKAFQVARAMTIVVAITLACFTWLAIATTNTQILQIFLDWSGRCAELLEFDDHVLDVIRNILDCCARVCQLGFVAIMACGRCWRWCRRWSRRKRSVIHQSCSSTEIYRAWLARGRCL